MRRSRRWQRGSSTKSVPSRASERERGDASGKTRGLPGIAELTRCASAPFGKATSLRTLTSTKFLQLPPNRTLQVQNTSMSSFLSHQSPFDLRNYLHQLHREGYATLPKESWSYVHRALLPNPEPIPARRIRHIKYSIDVYTSHGIFPQSLSVW